MAINAVIGIGASIGLFFLWARHYRLGRDIISRVRQFMLMSEMMRYETLQLLP
jgi:hypothetical protein